jgi:hypothetical protein
MTSGAVFVARPPRAPYRVETVDTNTTWGVDLPFVPRVDVLDVAAFSATPEVRALLASTGLPTTDCTPWLAPTWDRAPAPLSDANRDNADAGSFVRRTAFTRPDGRVVLQRTRTSVRDWVYGPPATPGGVQ